MPYNYQRIATLFVFSLLILQILAATSVQEANTGKKLTLTFDEVNKKITAITTEPTQTSSTDTGLEADAGAGTPEKDGKKDKIEPQQVKPQYDETDEEEEYEEIEIISEEEDAMLDEEDPMLDEEDPMHEEQDAMLEEQDPMHEEQDSMLEEQDSMHEEQDSMLEEQDPMHEEQDPMLGEQDPMLGEQDPMLGEEDMMGDETLENPPPPQEIEPFVDEEAEPSITVDAASASASLYDEDAISAHTLNLLQSSSTRPAVAQVTGCKTQGQIALTYSEGPSDVTAKIVRQLAKADARANFFVNATWLYTQQYAMVVQNVYNAGHFIGMTYRVPNDNSSALTDEDIRIDILNNAHIIETLINVAPKYVRLHYTEEKDVRTEGILRDLGFIIVGYNLDSQDYMKKEATGANSIQEIYSETFKKYKDTYDAKGSFISIQYDLPYTGSLNAVSRIINTIDEEGYTMVRLDGCLNDPKPYKRFANSTEYVGDKFSFQSAGYHQGQKSIVLDAADAADIEEDEFKIQGLETSQAAAQLAPFMTATLCIVGAIFTLFF
ncbi:uncharacterized protein ATC70_011276 [Mucor velutinosus]|uniref:NodB homology domain-containing protein n=1 Tax=Mucor velutinosus TaxID=708070 RepID=A0AAN7I0V5_9FUNG|nr:hypothetical protein ATC70_011276 [Mucor velutinosus]